MEFKSLFLEDFYSSLAILFLLFTILLLFFTRNVKVLYFSFFFFLLFSFFSSRINFIGLFFTFCFFINFYFFYKLKNRSLKYALAIVFILFSIALSLNQVSGFSNWKIISNIQIKEDSIFYSMFLNFDKSLVGLIPLLVYYQPMKTFKELKDMFILILPTIFLISFMLPIAAILIDYIRFDFKFHSIFWIWAIKNLLLTCVAEEVFFRTFLQNNFQSFFSKYNKPFLGVILASFLFGIAHFAGGISYVILSSIAGLFYGYAYYITKRLESSILLHFYLNCIHFIFFSYPALKT